MVGKRVEPEQAETPSPRSRFGVEPSYPTYKKMCRKAVHLWLSQGGTNTPGESMTAESLWWRYMDWATRRGLLWMTKRQLTSTCMEMFAFTKLPAGNGRDRYLYQQVEDWTPERLPQGRMSPHVPLFEPWMADILDPWKLPWIPGSDSDDDDDSLGPEDMQYWRARNFAAPDKWAADGEVASVPSWRIRQPGWDPNPDWDAARR